MKKSKIVALLALALTAVMLLSSCFGTTGIGKFLLDDATFDTNTLTTVEEISAIKKATYKNASGDLIYLEEAVTVNEATRTKHIVYNVATKAAVYTITDGEKTTYTVTLESVSYEGETYEYYTVVAEAITDDGTNYTTTIYDAKGTQIATATRQLSANFRYDICYFDGKVYKLDTETAAWTYAFDYAATREFPYIYEYSDKYYYAVGEDECGLIVYDKELNFVSSYLFPTYVDEDNVALILLENGNIFVQYAFAADLFSDDYTYISGSANKYIVKTFVVNAKNGNAKEIETDYVVLDYDNYDDEDGCKDTFFALVTEIKDQRYDTSDATYATISNSGKITPIKEIEDAKVRGINYVGQDRWVINCFAGVEFNYLVDAKGKVIGDVSGASFYGPYLTANGKIFNFDLEMLYDYKANELDIENAFGSAIIFENKKGDLLLFTGAGDPTVFIANDNEHLSIQNVYANGKVFVVRDTTAADAPKLVFYNNAGASIFTVNEKDVNSFSVVYNTDDYVIFSALNKDGERVYYTFA